MDINLVCSNLKEGAGLLALHNANQKNHALSCVAESIQNNKEKILFANQKDVERARAGGMSEALVERLALDEKKFKSILESMNVIIQQQDPVGQEIAGWKTPNGLSIKQVRVPLGIVAIIYESRPNVTIDAFALAYKSGNAILLRGSSSALESNNALVEAIKSGLENAGQDGVLNSIYLCQSKDHSDVEEILSATGKIDVVLPRGSSRLINAVVQNAKIPVIQTGAGVCHLYVDESASLDMAVEIAYNAKTQRPGACNAIETILVNRKIAKSYLPLLKDKFGEKVKVHADEESFEILQKSNFSNLQMSVPQDFGYEFLDLEVAVKIVENVEEAISFINSHNTKHSEAIVTNDLQNAKTFQSKIDAACVYVNASTRFTDGGEFGFGAELGISTQKLHARGPMGISALTTTKFLIDGDGQVR